MNGDILMKLITVNHSQIHVTPMTLRRFWVIGQEKVTGLKVNRRSLG